MSVSKKLSIFVIALFICLPFASVSALTVGDKVDNATVRDANDKPCDIPFLGEKVLILLYNDIDAADQNKPFTTLVKNTEFNKKKLKSIGVANMKDTWKPNSFIRMGVRKKMREFPTTLILTDPDYLLKKAWDLGETDDKSIVMIIGKDKKIYYKFNGKLNTEEQQKAVKLIKKLAK